MPATVRAVNEMDFMFREVKVFTELFFMFFLNGKGSEESKRASISWGFSLSWDTVLVSCMRGNATDFFEHRSDIKVLEEMHIVGFFQIRYTYRNKP